MIVKQNALFLTCSKIQKRYHLIKSRANDIFDALILKLFFKIYSLLSQQPCPIFANGRL